MSSTRNYDNTGQEDSTPKHYLTPKSKDAVFEYGRGENKNQIKGLVGYTDDADVIWKEEYEGTDKNGEAFTIPAHFLLKLQISGKDKDGEVMPHVFNYNTTHTNNFEKLTNQFLGFLDNKNDTPIKDTLIGTNIWKSKSGYTYITFREARNEEGFDRFEFSMEEKGYKGIPKSVDTGVPNPKNRSKNIWDSSNKEAFLVAHWLFEIIPAIRGKAVNWEFTQEQANKEYNLAVSLYPNKDFLEDSSDNITAEPGSLKNPDADTVLKSLVDTGTLKQIESKWPKLHSLLEPNEIEPTMNALNNKLKSLGASEGCKADGTFDDLPF